MPEWDVAMIRLPTRFETGRLRGVIELAAAKAGWGRELPPDEAVNLRKMGLLERLFDDVAQDRFDIAREHPILLQAVRRIMRQGATIFFSTNHQNFVPAMEDLPVTRLEDITTKTIPEDYVNKRKTIHRCWRITV